ncbi:MAG: PEP-CTERM sorting domain-containing protein [Chthoniobacteraceae bacterium]|nr:PEP-CTERM sorting domain-containing protein [Chthoniobacteraceae bacterium]
MKIKNILMTAAIALVGVASAHADSYQRGDLLLAFRAPTGTTGADINFVIDLGAATDFRNLTGTLQLANVGSQLASIYGSDWNSRTDLSWGVVSTDAKTGSAVNGDPAKTSYISLAEASFGTHSDDPTFGSGARSTISTQVYAFSDAFAASAGANATTGISMGSSTTGSWSYYYDDSQNMTYSFGSGISFEGAVGNGVDTSDAALDLFRILNTTSGANPTGTVGLGSYEGSFTLSNNGQISFTDNLQAVPEPSTYAMLGVGAVAAFGVMRRRRLSAAQA